MNRRVISSKLAVGWREWVSLPDLGVGAILAKVDTGAATCSIHAARVRLVSRGGRKIVRFTIPRESGVEAPVAAEAPLADERRVKSSNGLSEPRLVIRTRVRIGKRVRTVEVNLTSRHEMRHPMLLGRNLLRWGFMVDCSRSHLTATGP